MAKTFEEKLAELINQEIEDGDRSPDEIEVILADAVAQVRSQGSVDASRL